MGISSKNFSDKELSCSCCGENKMTQETVDALQALRESLGRPLKLSSAYRCPEHNSKVSYTGKSGPHTTGQAIDIACSFKSIPVTSNFFGNPTKLLPMFVPTSQTFLAPNASER